MDYLRPILVAVLGSLCCGVHAALGLRVRYSDRAVLSGESRNYEK